MTFLGSLARRAAAGLGLFTKDFGGVSALSDYGWTTIGRGGSFRVAGSDLDWEAEAGDLLANPVVAICIQYVFDKVIEPRVHVVYEDDEGMLQPVPKHPVSELLLHPNPEYHGNALQQALALSYKIDGNAYAIKVRGGKGSGVPVELWYIPHWLMEPMAPDGGGPTEFYRYRQPQPNGSYVTRAIPRANVVHIKNGMDPENPRKGLGQVRAQLRGIVSDNEIDSTVAVVLKNRGNIGTIISPAASDIEITPDQQVELVRQVEQKTTGDARGGMIALSLPVKVDRTTQSPKDLMLTEIGERPQSRICAAFGIDPAAVGLTGHGTGKGAQYGAKQREARASSYEQCILPLLAALAESFTYQLLPDFPSSSQSSSGGAPKAFGKRRSWVLRAGDYRGVDYRGANLRGSVDQTGNAVDYRVNFDYSEVRDLQEDKDASSTRACNEFKAGGATLDEFREALGRKPDADPELGGRYSWQLLPAPSGEFGVPPAADDDQAPPKEGEPSKPDTDIPNEEDEEDE